MFMRYFFLYDLDLALKRHGDHKWAEELGLFFVAGMLLLMAKPLWQLRRARLLLIGTTCGATMLLSGRPNGALAILIPILTILVGSAQTTFVSAAARFGDFSYGVYIYTFPVQQTVWCVIGDRQGVASSIVISIAATGCLAGLSWHLVEKNAVKLKPFIPKTG
jgi:peptidoglycan/LPS O-acetylase OafA/YrhL